MPHYEKQYRLIDKKSDAHQLNEFLHEEYKHGLFEFAFSLAAIISNSIYWGTWNLWFLKNEGIEFYNRFKAEISELKRIKQRLSGVVKQIKGHLNMQFYWDYLKGINNYEYPPHLQKEGDIQFPLDKESIIKKNYKLKQTFQVIEDEIAYYEELLKKVRPFLRRRGRPPKLKILIPAFWSYVMKDKASIHWNNIERLREWFEKKLKGSDYVNKLEVFPPAEPILEFLGTHGDILEAEIPFFFKDYEDIINPLGLQIDFARKEPRIWGLGNSKCSKRLPAIKFTDSSTFP